MEPTSESIWVDLPKIEGGQPGRRSKRRWRSRAANWESIMDVHQRPCQVSMYSTRRIDWAYQRVNQSWSAKFETGQTWRSRKRRSRKRRSRKNSESKVNDGRTPASLHTLNVLDEPSRLSQPVSQSELICKRSNGVSPAGGGGGGGGVEQRIESQ